MKIKPVTTSKYEFGCGFPKRSLDYMRRFYLDYTDRLPRIMQKASAQFAAEGILQKPSGEFQMGKIGQTASDQFAKLMTLERSSRKKNAIVELTLPAGANIHAQEYQLYLPSMEVLRQKLLDWVREQEEGV